MSTVLLKLRPAMANFAGIPPLRVTLRLQSRLFPVQLAKKNGVGQRSGSRGYGSSFPMKYVPKKTSENNPMKYVPNKASEGNKEEMSPPNKLPEENDVRALRFGSSRADRGRLAKVVSSNKELRDSIDRWSPMKGLLIDSSLRGKESHEKLAADDGVMESSYWEMEDEMSSDQEARDDEFMKGPAEFVEEIDHDQENIHKQDVLCNVKTRKDAEELAIKLLAKRAYTALEMRKKLHGKRFAAAIVDSLINDFQKRGLINDTLYAEAFSQSRWSSSSWGPGRIKQELLRKGVSRVNVDKAVRQVFESNADSTSDEGSRIVLSKDALDRLFIQASKQWLRSEGVPPETRKSRIVRWLQYRGFNWGVTGIILRRLEAQESS